MKICRNYGILLALLLLVYSSRESRADDQSDASPTAPISIVGIDGQPVSVENGADNFIVICFLGTECPLAKLYAPRLQTLASQFAKKSVRFIGVNSNQQDSISEWKRFVNERKIGFDCGKDYDQVLADHFSITRSPAVVVLDRRGEVRYQGRIDDQYSPGIARPQAQQEHLRVALEELIAGNAVSIKQTEPEGCLIGRLRETKSKSGVTYANQISRILQTHCVECHRSGEIGPFAMEEYEEIVGWAEMILETVDRGRMPPWHADPEHGSFLNERRLSDHEKELLHQWVADGAPLGDIASLPAAREFVTGWRLPRQPDRVIAMRDRPFVVPADGTIEYQYFVVDPEFTEDKWVSAAEVIPGSRSVVHHSIVFVRPPDGVGLKGVGWLAAYVPGQNGLTYDPQRARRIPAGSKLVFQQHYTPTGTEKTDITKVGIVFADPATITKELITLMAIDQEFEIPPETADYHVSATLPWVPVNGQLLSISPHMHFRGKSFSATLQTNETEEPQTLLQVSKYDFNWQHTYQLREPVLLNVGAQINIDVGFDNSTANPFNPDPDQLVTWGDQTWEEMAIGFFDVVVDLNENGLSNRTPVAQSSLLRNNRGQPANNHDGNIRLTPQRQQEVDEFVSTFFERFDGNNNGLVEFSELPLSLAQWGYRKYNTDGEPGLTREEIYQQAHMRFSRDD